MGVALAALVDDRREAINVLQKAVEAVTTEGGVMSYDSRLHDSRVERCAQSQQNTDKH